MKHALSCAALTLLLAACNGSGDSAGGRQATADPAQATPAATAGMDDASGDDAGAATDDAAPARQGPASAEEIAAIEATGQTGLWVEPKELCSKAKREVATLKWNVKASGTEKVIVYIVSKAGNERNFGRGGPVGRQSTGPWARGGQSFILRAEEGGAELGRTAIAETEC